MVKTFGTSLAAALFLGSLSLAQSVAAAARAQQQKHSLGEQSPRKSTQQPEPEKQCGRRSFPRGVITNDNLPLDSATAQASNSPSESEHSASSEFPHLLGTEAAAAQWKQQILAQKSAIASLQRQIDDLNSSVHFVEANRYWNGVQYNQRQVKKQNDVEQMRQQLQQQKQQLEQMQEAARRQGFGSAVYDP
jgi:hypothetical protein